MLNFYSPKYDAETLMDMFDTMSNTTGDVAATLIVAKKEGLVNMDVWSQK